MESRRRAPYHMNDPNSGAVVVALDPPTSTQPTTDSKHSGNSPVPNARGGNAIELSDTPPTSASDNGPEDTAAHVMSSSNSVEQLHAGGVQVQEIDEPTQRKLRTWNGALAGLHLVTGIIIGILTGTKQSESTVAWYTHLPPARPNGPITLWAPTQVFQADVPVGYFAMIFLLLAGLNHLLVSTVLWQSYLRNLSVGRNPVRWFEYSVSASLMHVHVAMISGCMDLHLCFLIFGLTMTTMYFGWLAEPRENGGAPDLRAFWAGFVPYVYQWAVVLCYFFSALSKGSPPGFVWAIIFIITILDLSFAVNMYLNLYRINKWSSFVYTEVAYCVLSLVSKQLLAWLNYGGTASLSRR